MRERVKWIDTARFLGIVSIYIGHIGSTAGLVYPYVFQYHVPLFFFISGCMSVYDKERNMGKFLLKKVKRLLLPMWVFAVLSVVISIIQAGSGESLMDNLLLIAKGCVRNSFLAGSLWFLSCLFVTEVIFKLLSLLMNRWIVLAAAAVMHIISTVLMNPSPVLVPRWWYNVDSMFYYILYYAIGSVVYPSIEKLFLLNSRRKKALFWILASLTAGVAADTFLGKNTLLAALQRVPYVSSFAPMMVALTLIWFNLVVAKLLEHIKWMRRIGQETLYLCGNEYLIAILFPTILGVFGLSLSFSTPLTTYCYVLTVQLLAVNFLIPAEKQIIASVMGKSAYEKF